jgi:hypothetical protein
MERRRRNELHQLDAYRCSLELYRMVGRMVGEFPRGEADLRSQMRRASRSVPFNIGEGVGKRGKARAAACELALPLPHNCVWASVESRQDASLPATVHQLSCEGPHAKAQSSRRSAPELRTIPANR